MFRLDKWKEIRKNKNFKDFLKFTILSKIVMLCFYRTVYNCNVCVKVLEETDCKQSHT